jgi:hypothetical protein
MLGSMTHDISPDGWEVGIIEKEEAEFSRKIDIVYH